MTCVVVVLIKSFCADWCVIYTRKKLFYLFTSFQTSTFNTVKFKTNSFFYFRMGKPTSNKANRDYCRRYREKNKDAIKEKERERKKMSRDYEKYLNTEKYQQLLHEDRIRSREYRRRKKAEASQASQTSSSSQDTSSSATSSQACPASQSAFGSRQSLFRNVSQAEKNLPNSPRKKSKVLSNLAKRYELRIQYQKKRGPKAKHLISDQEDWLMEVFERSDLTYTNPGRRDHVYTGKSNGEKQYVQKRYLLWSLHDALKIINGVAGFKDEFGESLSFSRLYDFIKGKKQIILQKDIPETSCLCEICENASLMAKAVSKRRNAHPTNAHDIVERYSCDCKNISCITNDCAECKPEKIIE